MVRQLVSTVLLLSEMLEVEVVFDAMHPQMHMGIFRQLQAGLVSKAVPHAKGKPGES